MVYKDEVCMWFKDNESHRRLELLCGLLNMCLPFELRFIRTCAEDLGKRDDLLRDFDLKANNSSEINQLGKVLDERTRSKFVVYVALLEANNQTCSKILFETLSNAQELPNSALSNNLSDINYIKEMLLIYTMVLHHPAFTFEEKRVIGDRFESLQDLEKQITQTKKPWSHNKSSFGLEVNSQDLSIDTCHSISSPTHVYEACDSGLSIGTEPEAEVLSDHVCVPTGNRLPHGQSSLSTDNTFNDLPFSQSSPTNSRPTLNPSIGNSSEKLPSSSLVNLSKPPSLMQHEAPPENQQHILPNRDASSSGSGESLDLYGESVSVPTTYIYNSNIYDQQGLNEVPTMALGNNLINLTPGYMYQHNGRCQFYHYPPLMGGVLSPSSVSVPRKAATEGGISSETSSSEEGVNGAIPASNTKLLLLRSDAVPPYSSLSSSQSSPYASPPQSPNGSTVTTSAPSLESPQSFVTGTTTTIDLPKSSPRPPVRNRCHTSSPGPIPTSNQIISRCKPPNVTKGQKHPTFGERPNLSRNRGSPNLCLSENTNGSSIISAPGTNGPNMAIPFVSKENDSPSGSFTTNKEAVLSPCTSATSLNGAYVRTNARPLDNILIIPKHNGMLSSCNATNSLQCQNLDTAIQPKTVVSVTAPQISSASLTCPPLNNGSLELSISPPMSSMLTSDHQQDSHNDTELMPSVKANNRKNFKEENHMKDNSSEEIKVIEEVEKLRIKSALEEKVTSVVSLPNGFSEYSCISSSGPSIQVKHSDSQTLTTSVPSCSCTTVSLHSDPCKMSVSTVGNSNRQRIIPPHNVATDNFTGKINRPVHSTDSTPQNSLHSLLPSVAHTVSTKMLYNSQSLHSTEAPVIFSSPRPSLPSTCPPIIPHTTTHMNASSKYSCSTVTMIHSSTNGAPVFKKTRPTENGQQLQVSAPPTGPAFIGGNGKATPAANTPPTFTTTTSSTSTTMMSLMPSPGTYPPYFSIPMLPGGASSYLPQMGFSHHTHTHPRNHPSHAFFLASPSGLVHSPSGPLMKGNPSHSILLPPGSNLGHPKSRGSSSGRSGSNSSGSSSSSSSGLGRKKTFVRSVPHQNKSRSSDSSPSSSQYSSPPQTPSPDHTHEGRSKPPKGAPVVGGKLPEGVAYPVEEGWEAPDSSGAPCLPCSNSREEGTPPPHPLGPQIMIPSNPVRQRYIPYPPVGFIGYPQPPHVMYRYSLTSPSMLMGSPRTQTPLGSEKSSRETTPPIHSHVPPPPPLDKSVDFPMNAAPSSTSPPIPAPLSETNSVTLVPPPPGPPPPAPAGPPPTGGTMHQYNSPNYPMFAMGTAPFVAHLSGFLPSSSGLPNGYVSPHTLPPNFPVPSVAPGMTSGGGELMYPPGAPFQVITQTTLATSSSCGVVAAHPTVPPPYSGPPYQAPLLPSNSVPLAPKKPQSCYNCGKVGHRGAECHETSIDEMTKRTKVL